MGPEDLKDLTNLKMAASIIQIIIIFWDPAKKPDTEHWVIHVDCWTPEGRDL
jgi:hypothetical protein